MVKFLKALAGKNSGRPPIWLMRQAGRYMPEYLKLRSKYSFLELCRTSNLATEVTLLPIKTFGFDAAILFSDILIIADSLGIEVEFHEGLGPLIKNTISNEVDVNNLSIKPPEEALSFVSKSIQMLKTQLDVPLIGFCGAPFTVASYFVEGKTSKDLKKSKQWLYKNPQGFHKLLDKITQSSIAYLKMQVAAGVDALQIFDSWAYLLSHETYREFAWKPLQKIVEALRPTKVPLILFSLGSANIAPALAELNPTAISIDWNSNLTHLRKKIPTSIALQGNLDPHLLYAPPPIIQYEVEKLLQSMKGDPSYIFNLGHGILPDTPVESVKTLIQTIHQYA